MAQMDQTLLVLQPLTMNGRQDAAAPQGKQQSRPGFGQMAD